MRKSYCLIIQEVRSLVLRGWQGYAPSLWQLEVSLPRFLSAPVMGSIPCTMSVPAASVTLQVTLTSPLGKPVLVETEAPLASVCSL